MTDETELLLRFRQVGPALKFTYDTNSVCLLVAFFAAGHQITGYPIIPIELLSEINSSALSKEWT